MSTEEFEGVDDQKLLKVIRVLYEDPSKIYPAISQDH